MNEFTVTEINRKIAALLKSDDSLSDVTVKGEISNLTIYPTTGHIYFTLKDEGASVKAVMFKRKAAGLKFKPSEGMSVAVRGEVRVYEKDGQCRINAVEITPEGQGALYLSFLNLKEKLGKEGLFTQKRTLPRNPSIIAVITSETGAALQDILNITARRNPFLTVIIIPAVVQGVNSPASLISAIEKAQSSAADLIIIGRGGGSIEDLWSFNDEGVARALFASKIPTVSAVGHETDTSITDFVADLRAPTPSAAAEICVPDIGEVYASLGVLRRDLKTRISRLIAANTTAVDSISRVINAKSPSAMLDNYEKRFNAAGISIKNAVSAVIESKKQRLISQMNLVSSLNPVNVLMRGYSIVSVGGRTLLGADGVNIGDTVDIRLHKGGIKAEVKEKHD